MALKDFCIKNIFIIYSRGGQYAICLALVIDGKVELGVIGCPNLSIHPVSSKSQDTPPVGCLMYAEKNKGAYQEALGESIGTSIATRIQTSTITSMEQVKFCESFESKHSNHGHAIEISRMLGIVNESIRMDSQCKYGVLGRGDVEVYLRLPIGEYIEKIWDHAAGSLIVVEAGGVVSDVFGKELDFSMGRLLSGNKGVIGCCNEVVHGIVIKVVQEVMLR